MARRIFPALILLMIATASLAVNKEEGQGPAQSIGELRQQLEKILKDTHTPGMSVAIVRKDGPEWVAGLGIADVASNRPATADTLFRIGSTSKAFVSLAILKLAREKKLSLDDPVSKLVPEVVFENRWEATDPVRVVHLLEHTTGWDDQELNLYAKDAPGIDLRTALNISRASRVSRWPPGRWMSYCNTGPAVAAYIVEKVTGQRFEDYVQQNLFGPMGMRTATYFQPPAGESATLYHADGKTPYSYWNILFRPVGSINASANDMARLMQFYLNRGIVNGVQVTPAADIDRLESPETTWAAQDGLKIGYGLGNHWSIMDGFIYHGHGGAIPGGSTNVAYLPDHGVGFVFSINAGSGEAFSKLNKAICGYITLRFQRPAVPAPGPLPVDAADYTGWYEPIAVRPEIMHFLFRLTRLSLVQVHDGQMAILSYNLGIRKFLPVTGRLFRFVPKAGPPDPVASMVLLSNKRFIANSADTLVRIPSWLAYSEILLTGFFLVAIVSIALYAPLWLIGGLMKRHPRPAERAMLLCPLIAVLSLTAFVRTITHASIDSVQRFGNLTVWSGTVFVTTIVFAVATLLGAWSVATARSELVRRPVLWFSAIVSVALVIALGYLTYWGIIGLRTWA